MIWTTVLSILLLSTFVTAMGPDPDVCSEEAMCITMCLQEEEGLRPGGAEPELPMPPPTDDDLPPMGGSGPGHEKDFPPMPLPTSSEPPMEGTTTNPRMIDASTPDLSAEVPTPPEPPVGPAFPPTEMPKPPKVPTPPEPPVGPGFPPTEVPTPPEPPAGPAFPPADKHLAASTTNPPTDDSSPADLPPVLPTGEPPAGPTDEPPVGLTDLPLEPEPMSTTPGSAIPPVMMSALCLVTRVGQVHKAPCSFYTKKGCPLQEMASECQCTRMVRRHLACQRGNCIHYITCA